MANEVRGNAPERVRQALAALGEQADAYVQAGKAGSTRRAYASDWQDFLAWADWRGLAGLPAEPSTVALYLAALAVDGKRPATIERRRAAIAFAHKVAGHISPTHHAMVDEVIAGIRRELGAAQHGKTPALSADVRAMVERLPGDLRGARDRALLLLGFAGAFRRSELVALDVEDVLEAPAGLLITIRRGKTDQEGRGRRLAIPYGQHAASCPVRAYQDWRHAAALTSGALFRGISSHGQLLGRLSDKGVARTVKRAAEAAGLDPARYSGHSLRAGLATSAAAGGALDRDIMRQTGHQRVETLYRYIRKEDLFTDNVVRRTDL